MTRSQQKRGRVNRGRMGGERASKAKNPQLLPSPLLQRRRPAQNLVRSAMAQSIWKGTAAVVDMRAQSSEEREEKRLGEVSGGSGASTG